MPNGDTHTVLPTDKVHTAVPGAARVVSSLRSVGYETHEAVADIVDNSISADAGHIDITSAFDGAGSWIRIVDDGHGMDAETLTESLRYGAESQYGVDALGKFGLGLKTASTSQARRVEVASRTSTDSPIEVRFIDLDDIEAENDWRILERAPDDCRPELVAPLADSAGTVVLWSKLDRILDYKDPGSAWAKDRMIRVAEAVDDHLSLVFHRFLDGSLGSPPLTMTVNGERIRPWDPFAREEKRTTVLEPLEVELGEEGSPRPVLVEPFILPNKETFSSTSAWEQAGRGRWAQLQGFFVYRANRLIHFGGWARMRSSDEKTKYARVALFFGPELDDLFEINIAKMKVQMPPELRAALKPKVTEWANQAKAAYNASGETPGVPTKKGKAASAGGKKSKTTASTPVTLASCGAAIKHAAKAQDVTAQLKKIQKQLRKQSPEIAEALDW